MKRAHAERIKFDLADSVIETARRLHTALNHDPESIEDPQWEAEDALGHLLGHLATVTTRDDPDQVKVAEGFIYDIHAEAVEHGECSTLTSAKAEGAIDALAYGALDALTYWRHP